jgi:DNA-binding response OmpR family regulator
VKRWPMSLPTIDRVRSAEIERASHVLVVGDDPLSTLMLRRLLQGQGYKVTTAKLARSALEPLDQKAYDLILLDIMMPEMSGLDLCRRIRETSDVPILFLSVRSDVADTVLGLRAGADDYITKPYKPGEVLARIGAQLRRAGQHTPTNVQLRHTDLTMDMAKHMVTLHRTHKSVDLTPLEFRLLHALLRSAGRNMSREVLVPMLWGYHYDPRGNELDVHIRRLRRKVEKDPSHPKLIQTVRGVGYRLRSAKAPARVGQPETNMQSSS